MAEARLPLERGRAARRAAAMVLVAATLWGLSGTVAQDLMQHTGVPLAWLATARMALAGVGLLALAGWRYGTKGLLAPWRTKRDSARLLMFSVAGLFLVQYSYLAAVDIANAANATVIQYLGSGFVVLWLALARRRAPPIRHVMALMMALLGIALLATNGSAGRLALPAAGLAWGLVSAVTLALYTILPQPLLRRFGTLPVLGWAMLIAAGCAVVALHPAPLPPAVLGPQALGLMAFIVVLGTVAPFALYLGSMRRLAPSEAALLANAEPVAAAVAALLWLHVRLGVWAAAGACLVLVATTDLFRTSGAAQATDATADGHAPPVRANR